MRTVSQCLVKVRTITPQVGEKEWCTSPLQGMRQVLHPRDPEEFKGPAWRTQTGSEKWRPQKWDRCSCPWVQPLHWLEWGQSLKQSLWILAALDDWQVPCPYTGHLHLKTTEWSKRERCILTQTQDNYPRGSQCTMVHVDTSWAEQLGSNGEDHGNARTTKLYSYCQSLVHKFGAWLCIVCALERDEMPDKG